LTLSKFLRVSNSSKTSLCNSSSSANLSYYYSLAIALTAKIEIFSNSFESSLSVLYYSAASSVSISHSDFLIAAISRSGAALYNYY